MLEDYEKYRCPKTLVGVWDFGRAPFRLGNILIFSQNLHLIREFTDSQSVDLAIICDLNNEFSNKRIGIKNYRTYLSTLLSYFLLTDTITSSKIFTSREDFDDYFLSVHHKGYPHFPQGANLPDHCFDYRTLALNKEFLSLNGKLSFAKINQDSMEKAHSFLATHTMKQLPIAVHIRYDRSHRTEGNARLDVWIGFFEETILRHPETRFVFVGNDDFPDAVIEKIRALPNVLRTKDYGLTVLEELPIIQASVAFMGTASGPCHAAIFGEKPYLTIKHPQDAWAERFSELEDGDRFPFARPHQYLKVTEESPEILRSFLDGILS